MKWILINLALGLILQGCFQPPAPSVAVKTAPIKRGKMGALLISSGQVRARRRAVLSAAEGGMVTRIEVAEGDRVLQGQPLIYLGVRRRETQVEVQQARLEQAQARLAQIRSQLHSSQKQHGHKLEQSKQAVVQARISVGEAQLQVDASYRDWKRKAQLLTEKSISLSEVEQAELQWKIKKDELRQALSRQKTAQSESRGVLDSRQDLRSTAHQVAEAEGAVREAEANLNDSLREETETILRAPISGMVSNLKVVAGQTVSGESLGTIIDTDDMEVIASLDPAQVNGLGRDTPATLHSPLLGNKGVELRFVDLISAVEGKGNTVRARFRYRGRTDHRLVDGLQVQVYLQMPEKKGWLIPRDAIGEDQMRRTCVRVVRNQEEIRVHVVVLSSDASQALCEGDLFESDQLVIAGNDLAPGTQVTPTR
jgi:multidrug resistance efflux pump